MKRPIHLLLLVPVLLFVACDDDDLCTDDSCDALTGLCAFFERSCNDNDPCTIDLCDPRFGCLYADQACDDLNPCTIDACDPATGHTAELTSGQSVPAAAEALAESLDSDLVAVIIDAQCQDVTATIAFNLPNAGTPLRVPGVDTSLYQRTVKWPNPAGWHFIGLYARDEAGQLVVSVPGHALHLHGVRDNRSTGGHIAAATALSGTIHAYPVASATPAQADLTVAQITRANDTVTADIENLGANRVRQCQVAGTADGQTLALVTIYDLAPGATQAVSFGVTDEIGEVTVTVDPDGQVDESNEGNNTWQTD